MTNSDARLLAIVGPTATGKSEVGLLLAERLDGEIVSADSMQIYRGMDIGTAKPTGEQRARVPHHLIDLLEPDEAFSVSDYRARAEAALADIWRRGHQPILVGGSGLYVRAVLQEMDFSDVPPNPELRQELQREARDRGSQALHRRLEDVDPATAARLHPNDTKRIIRALEVFAGGGAPAPSLGSVDRGRAARYNTRQFGLSLGREELYRRIDERVDRMIAAGLVEEVRALLERGCDESLTSMKGLGYAQLLPHVRGEVSLDEAVRVLKRDTRRFAKRQFTWFRADPVIEWIDVEEAGGPVGVAEAIIGKW
ncbi:MAG: tRNA (adenosine(37)-N6)-dimethylallyltransferase MiaA [Armatimonadetes bacterium]|nr:tRNA (adenosine(37)-N6)-dimethylallyltransferase MiaA [Armatimonadota bacterium]